MAPLRSLLSTKYCVTCSDEKSPFVALRITLGLSSEALMLAFLATFVNLLLAAKKVVIFVKTHDHGEPINFHHQAGVFWINARTFCVGRRNYKPTR